MRPVTPVEINSRSDLAKTTVGSWKESSGSIGLPDLVKTACTYREPLFCTLCTSQSHCVQYAIHSWPFQYPQENFQPGSS